MTADATVAVPVRNAGGNLAALLEAVTAQRYDGEVEVLVCDSGSTDGSAELSRRYGARVIEISALQFGHGRTRNLLMQRSHGTHVAFLTQDTLPVDDRWLERLLAGFALAPDVGLVFGPYQPRPEASAMVARELTQWFGALSPSGEPRVDRLGPNERELAPRELLGPRGFFTDANGCVARRAWERVPFRDIAYAEDHALAHDMLRAGYAKVFSPQAAVIHSHDYSSWGWLQRSFDEARALRGLYGWREPLDPRTVALNIWGRVGADRRWAQASEARPSGAAGGPELLVRSALYHMARAAGSALGGNAERLPPSSSGASRTSVVACDSAGPSGGSMDPRYAWRMSTPAIDGARLPAVVARGVSKSFTVPEERTHTLKERALHPRRQIRHQTFHALNDITFHVQRGEFFGIAGRNGSGKSTLLKCLAGIYRAEGDIWCRGRLSTFIELGVGFNPDMAARENVVMNGIMLGLSPREARKRYEAVIEFAELQEFKDLKLKNYSSGMHVRLAFSVAIQVDAEILLIDEVLAVGDAAFQQKCFDVFNEMRDSGRTIVFVTHDMGSMQRFCHRALLLERGSMVYLGEPPEVADRYLEINFGRDPESADQAQEERSGDGEARVLEAWVEDPTGERLAAVGQHERVTLNARVAFMVDVEDPSASVYVLNEEHKAVIVANTAIEHERSGRFAPGEEVVFSFTFDNVLAPGRYSPMFTIAHRGSGLDLMDRFEGAFSFVVTGATALGGIVDLPVQATLRRAQAADGERAPV